LAYPCSVLQARSDGCFLDVPSANKLQQGRCYVLHSFALDPAAGPKSCELSVADRGEREGVEKGGHLPGRRDGQLHLGSSVVSLLEPKPPGLQDDGSEAQVGDAKASKIYWPTDHWPSDHAFSPD